MPNRLSPDLFRRRTVPDPTTGCWVWQGATGKAGRPCLDNIIAGPHRDPERIPAEPWLMHRASYAVHHGPLKRKFKVVQVCGNDLCVNPNHLAQVRCGDGPCASFPVGAQKLPRVRVLKEADVRDILTSTESDAVCAERLIVNRSTVTNIRIGRRKALVAPDLPRRPNKRGA